MCLACPRTECTITDPAVARRRRPRDHTPLHCKYPASNKEVHEYLLYVIIILRVVVEV